MTNSSSRPPISGLEKLLLVGATLLLAGLLGGGTWLSRINAEPQIAFPTPVPTPNPNGYDLYVAASNALVPARPPVDEIDDTHSLSTRDPKRAARDFSLARQAAWLKQNASGFALMQQAERTPTRYFNARDPILSHLTDGPLRNLMREKLIETHVLVAQKKWNDAVQSSLDDIQMGNDCAIGADWQGKMIGSSITAMGRNPLVDTHFLPEKLDARQARAAAARLEAMLMRRWSYSQALEEQRWSSLSHFLQLTQTAGWRTSQFGAGTSWLGRGTSWRDKIAVRTLTKSQIVARINHSFDLQIADVKRPYSAPTSPKLPDADPLSGLFSFDSNRFRRDEAREIVPLNILLLRFVLRAYRLENGAYPANLSQLAPKYVAKIPTDYYDDGTPFHYILKNNDFRLWSVGPDGKDDGGTPIKWRLDGSSGAKNGHFPPFNPQSQGDYVARENN